MVDYIHLGERMDVYMRHEDYISRVREIVAAHVDGELASRVRSVKLVYGIGDGSYRGVCYYNKWQNGEPKPEHLCEIAASGEEHPIQLAGTTIHELAHTLAEGDGHGKEWRRQASVLGLRLARAAGHVYMLASFSPSIRSEIAQLAVKLADGKPLFHGGTGKRISVRPCSVGIGTRGGTSRGKGSGSRLRLWVCECEKPVKVRIASDDFRAHCDTCGQAFKRQESEAN